MVLNQYSDSAAWTIIIRQVPICSPVPMFPDFVTLIGAGLNDGLFQKRWTSAVNRRSIVTLPSVLSAVCIAEN